MSAPAALAADFQHERERTARIFGLAAPEAYYVRPIPLRHPLAFYDGHLDAFIWNKLFREGLGESPFAPELDALFARGIDPASAAEAARQGTAGWPERSTIEAYKARVRNRLFDMLARAEAVTLPAARLEMVLEHEAMHQETLLYMLHQLPEALKVAPEGLPEPDLAAAPSPEMKTIPAGIAVLGAREGEFPFGWDNEFPRTEVALPSFAIDAYNVTNGQFLEFVEAGGYQRRAFWDDASWAWQRAEGLAHPFYWSRRDGEWFYRAFFGEQPLPRGWPVIVTHAEAQAYARFVQKRLPSEAEWHRAAFGDRPESPYPWGAAGPSAEHGNFDFALAGPTRVGAYPKGASPYGVHDLVGNGWEWTASVFAPFPGFQACEAYPRYSADFFDGQHYVLKGASWATPKRLIRRSFRNWFYWHYPYMYATFRCVER